MRCFSFADITQKRVPELESFNYVSAEVKRTVLVHHRYFRWVVMYGSYLYGKHNRASDVDIAFCFKEGISSIEREAALLVIQQVRQAGHDYSLPIKPGITTVEDLGSGSYIFEEGFLEHIRVAAEHGGQIVGTPCMIPFPKGRAYDDARTYIGSKLRKAQLMISLPEAERSQELWYDDWLSDVLSVWKHIARRVARIKGYTEKNEADLLRIFQSSVRNPEILSYYEWLNTVRESYIVSLNQCLAEPDEATWLETIRKLELAGSIFLEFTQLIYNKLCETPP